MQDIIYGQPPFIPSEGGPEDGTKEDEFEQYYARSCGPHLPPFANPDCSKYDPNLYCDKVEKKCRCKKPYVKLKSRDLCYDVSTIIHGPLFSCMSVFLMNILAGDTCDMYLTNITDKRRRGGVLIYKV